MDADNDDDHHHYADDDGAVDDNTNEDININDVSGILTDIC